MGAAAFYALRYAPTAVEAYGWACADLDGIQGRGFVHITTPTLEEVAAQLRSLPQPGALEQVQRALRAHPAAHRVRAIARARALLELGDGRVWAMDGPVGCLRAGPDAWLFFGWRRERDG